MFEQLRVVWLSYSQRRPFQRFVVLGFVWLAIVAWYTHGRGMSPRGYLMHLFVVLLAFALAIGYVVRTQFVSWRSRLLPRFAAAHLIVAAGLSVSIACILAGFAWISRGGFSGVTAQWQDVSVVGIFTVAWSFTLLTFALVYFSSPESLVLGLLLMLGLGSLLGAGIASEISGRSVPLILVGWHHPYVLALLDLLNAAVTIVLGRRMMQVHEEMRECWSIGLLDRRGAQKLAWSENRLNKGALARANATLDEIPQHLGNDIRSQVSHFRRGFGFSQPSFVRLTLALVACRWVVNFFHPLVDFPPESILFGVVCGASYGLYFQIQRSRLPWVFMLPLSRKEIVTRFGGAVFLQCMKMWLSFVLAIYFVFWMPLPGTIRGLPSVWTFVLSFVVLFPICGIVTLAASRPRAIPETALALMILISAFLAVASGEGHRWLLLTISVSALGAALIAWSYRSWLQFEFD